MDENVIDHLTPMFPQLTVYVIKRSVQHASNRLEPLDAAHLLQRCIDDLLCLRTYKLETSLEEPLAGMSHLSHSLRTYKLETSLEEPLAGMSHLSLSMVWLQDKMDVAFWKYIHRSHCAQT